MQPWLYTNFYGKSSKYLLKLKSNYIYLTYFNPNVTPEGLE